MNRTFIIFICLVYVMFMAVLFFNLQSKGEPFQALVAAGGMACGSIPIFLVLFTNLHFKLGLVFAYILFLFGSQYLGTIAGWYGLGWWDTFVHFVSGGILAFTGITLYERLIEHRARKEISSWFIFLFTFSFTVLGGVIWEIYEFSSDQFFRTTLQGNGVTDTMTDLSGGLVGGLIIATWEGIRTKLKWR